MLLGQVQHNLDEKGRIVLPALFREQLHGPLYLALGENNELGLWPEASFVEKMDHKQSKELESPEGAREFARFSAFSGEAKMDAQFRIAIPEKLREKAGFDRSRPLVLVGMRTRLAIWDAARFEAYVERPVAL
jgi:MraZ protein